MSDLIRALVYRRYLFSGAAIIVALVVAWGITLTGTETGTRAILSDSDPYMKEVEQTRADFPPSTSVMFVFETDTDVFATVHR